MADFKIVSTKDLTFPTRNTTSKYDNIVAAAAKLRPGQSMAIPVTRGVKATAFRNRVAAAVRRKVTPSRGSLTIRVVDEKSVAISCKAPTKSTKKKTSKKTRKKAARKKATKK